MKIPILSGIYTDSSGGYRSAYPRNYRPVMKDIGYNVGYLRPTEGIELFASTSGIDRGGINWNGVCYRVIGTQLFSVSSSGALVSNGSIAGSGKVTMDYSFDVLSISNGSELYYFDGSSLTQNTDSDLGNAIDHLWVDGYFMTTDSTSLVVTELNDRYSVLPTKYGSSEADPDSVKGLIKLRREVYALNRYTCELFQNTGGSGFPFSRIEGAMLQRGCVGTHAACVYQDNIAFIGGGRNEAISVWVGGNGQTKRIATEEIDKLLSAYSESELSESLVESRSFQGGDFLYIHLPDRTMVFDGAASQLADFPVWFCVDSGGSSFEKYKARNFVNCYDKWIVGDPTANRLGVMTDSISSHYGSAVDWEIITPIIYTEGMSAILHRLELVGLPGRQSFGVEPSVWYSYSEDGMEWSSEDAVVLGDRGNRTFRPVWNRLGLISSVRFNKFRGNSDAHMSISRLEATMEVLNG